MCCVIGPYGYVVGVDGYFCAGTSLYELSHQYIVHVVQLDVIIFVLLPFMVTKAGVLAYI